MAVASFNELGAVVVRNDWESGDAIFTAAMGRDADALFFVNAMCAVRQSRRRPLEPDVLVQQYADTFNEDATVIRTQYRQLYFCMRRFYACYICLRGIAAPLLVTSERHQVSHLPRRARRVLSATGMVHHRGMTVAERASSNTNRLLDDMKDRQCVMWVDNFYKMRFGINPGQSDHSVNATAMTIMLNVRVLGRFTMYPSLTEVHNRLGVLVRDIVRADTELVKFVRSCFGGITDDAIRVPLDIVRERAKGQKWHPYKLTDTVLGSMKGVLEMLNEVQEVKDVSGRPVPVLMDENVHYRLMRMLYSKTFSQYRVRETLNEQVFLYGVWHAYKFVCLHLHREFFTLFTFVDQGLLNAGDTVSCVQKLGFIERSVAALWITGMDVLKTLDKEIHRLLSYVEGVETRAACQRRTVPRTAIEECDWLRDVFTHRVPGSRRRLIPARLWILMQLRLLITELCPAIFLIGHKVRTCTWEARALGSGTIAKECLMMCLNVMLRLSPPDARPLRYVRTVCVALLTWTPWHDTSPGVIHVEESCEAMLSKVVRTLSTNPNACTHERYQQIFQSLETSKTKRVLNTRVPPSVLVNVREKLEILCGTNCVPPLVRWHANRPQRADCRVMPPMVFDDGPPPFIRRQSSATYAAVLKRCLETLIGGGQLTADQRTLMDEAFPRRTHQEVADLEADVFLVQGEISVQPTRRVRRREGV